MAPRDLALLHSAGLHAERAAKPSAAAQYAHPGSALPAPLPASARPSSALPDAPRPAWGRPASAAAALGVRGKRGTGAGAGAIPEDGQAGGTAVNAFGMLDQP